MKVRCRRRRFGAPVGCAACQDDAAFSDGEGLTAATGKDPVEHLSRVARGGFLRPAQRRWRSCQIGHRQIRQRALIHHNRHVIDARIDGTCTLVARRLLRCVHRLATKVRTRCPKPGFTRDEACDTDGGNRS